jgi:hypothetical protein
LVTDTTAVYCIGDAAVAWDRLTRDYALLFSRQNVAGIAISFEKSLEKPGRHGFWGRAIFYTCVQMPSDKNRP